MLTDISSFATNLSNKYRKQLSDTQINASKKVVHKAVEFIGNNIAETVTNSYNDKIVKTKPVKK